MLNFVWRQLRGRAGRSVALLAGILVATTGFVVLTGATTTSRLAVTGTVEQNTRAAYDILVRPKGTRTPLEAERGLVRPNYLSGLYGGITTAQYDEVKAVDGVDVAAPIAMLGYSTAPVPLKIDLTDAVDRSLDRQVLRVDRTFVAERGLSTAKAKANYVYVTRHPLIYPVFDTGIIGETLPYSDGRSYPVGTCGTAPREVLPDGRSQPICDPWASLLGNPAAMSERDGWNLTVVRLRPDGRFEAMRGLLARGDGPAADADRLVLAYETTVPFLLAAVDPGAEDRLVGFNGSVVDGRALRDAETPTEREGGAIVDQRFPVLVTNRPFIDSALRTGVTRIPGLRISGVPVEDLEQTLDRAKGISVVGGEQDVTSGFRSWLDEGLSETGCCFGQLQVLMQSGEATYDPTGAGTLRAEGGLRTDPEVYGDYRTLSVLPRPWLADDIGSRQLRRLAVAQGKCSVPVLADGGGIRPGEADGVQ